MSKETKTILNDSYAQRQIEHMRNLLDLVEYSIDVAKETGSGDENRPLYFGIINDNLSVLREEAIQFKYKAFCEVVIDNHETNQ